MRTVVSYNSEVTRGYMDRIRIDPSLLYSFTGNIQREGRRRGEREMEENDGMEGKVKEKREKGWKSEEQERERREEKPPYTAPVYI